MCVCVCVSNFLNVIYKIFNVYFEIIVFPAYSLQLLKLLQDKLATTQDLVNTVLGFRKQLTTEEQFSQNINRGGHR